VGENAKSMQEAEVMDDVIETAPEAGGLVKAEGGLAIADQLALADNMGKLVEAQNKIRLALLSLAQPGDWVIFGEGEKAKAEIGFAGSMRIGSTLGISFTDFEARKESDVDEIGPWYRWEVECTAHYRGREVRLYGRAGSRDKFFGKVRGQFKPLHEVDEGNVKMAARRAAMKEGVKVLFGLHHMDPEYLKKNGVRLESAGGYNFKDQEQKAAEVSEAKGVKIDTITQKVGEKWTKYTITAAGVSFGTFDKKIAEIAKTAKDSGGAVDITYKFNEKYGNEIVTMVAA